MFAEHSRLSCSIIRGTTDTNSIGNICPQMCFWIFHISIFRHQPQAHLDAGWEEEPPVYLSVKVIAFNTEEGRNCWNRRTELSVLFSGLHCTGQEHELGQLRCTIFFNLNITRKHANRTLMVSYTRMYAFNWKFRLSLSRFFMLDARSYCNYMFFFSEPLFWLSLV